MTSNWVDELGAADGVQRMVRVELERLAGCRLLHGFTYAEQARYDHLSQQDREMTRLRSVSTADEHPPDTAA